MIITFICDVLGEENNGTTIATMNVIRAMRAKGHEVRIVCCDENKRGQEGYFIVPAINFGLFNGYVKKNGVHPASKKDEATIRKALEGADICHFNFCGFLSARSVDIAHVKILAKKDVITIFCPNRWLKEGVLPAVGEETSYQTRPFP